MSESGTFVCSVCGKRRDLLKDGQVQYLENPKSYMKQCYVCVNDQDRKEMESGHITLALELEDGHWFARNRSGKLRFPLVEEAGETPAMVIGKPRFVLDGQVWSGRHYPGSGTAHFQRKAVRARGAAKGRATAGARGTANGTPRAKTPRAKTNPAAGAKTRRAQPQGRAKQRTARAQRTRQTQTA